MNTSNPKKMFVIDDEPNVLDSMYEIFNDDYQVALFDNAPNALELLTEKKDRPDIVLMDIKMPGMSGIEALYTIKQEMKDLPVIIVSGAESSRTTLNILHLKPYDYVHKPFDVFKLKKLVSDAVHNKTIINPVAPADFSPLTILSLLKHVLKISVDVVEADSGLLLLTSDAREDIIISIVDNHVNLISSKQREEVETAIGKYYAQENKEPSLIKDLNDQPWPFIPSSESRLINSIICIPLNIDSYIYNVMILTRSITKPNFDLTHLEWGKLLGQQTALIAKNVQLEKLSNKSCLEAINASATFARFLPFKRLLQKTV